MSDNKALTIIGYILIFILLSPIIAILLYVGVGGLLFYILAITSRVKKGRLQKGEGKIYKYVATGFFLIGIFVAAMIYRNNEWTFTVFNWKDVITANIIAFVGFFPLVIFYFLKLKKVEE